MESHIGLHDITVLTLALRHAYSNLFGMATMGRFYVLGPPVQHAFAVKDLVLTVMRQIPELDTEAYILQGLDGPVRYDASWVQVARNALRRGMEVADLWTGQVVWIKPTMAKSFSVVVMDQQYLDGVLPSVQRGSVELYHFWVSD